MNKLDSIVDYLKVFNNIETYKKPEPRNMYAGGQLVAPSVDGSRPGYNGLPTFVTKDPRSKSKPYRVKVKASEKLGRDKFEGKFSSLKKAKAKAAEFSGGKPGVAADPSIPKQTQKIVDRYNSLIKKGLEKKNLSNIDFFETWLRKNYPDNYGILKSRIYTPDYNIKYTDITKAKEQLAKTLVDDSFKIERMVKYQDIYDKLGFSRSAEASPTIRNIVDKGLKNQLPKKVNLAFNNIIKEDAFINGTLTNTIAERIGMVPTGATRWREYLTNNPNWKKNKKVMEYTFSSNAKIPGTTFSEMFDEGKYRIGGGVKWSGKQTQFAGVRKNIMDYALTHWHRNNYDKGTSLIEFFDSKGNPIKWKPGLKLNISDVQFKIPSESDKMWSYRGKPKGSSTVSGQDARASGIFDEVTATYKTQQDLAGSWVTHPVSGKKVKYADLMDEVYRKGYGWTGKSTITAVDIDHFKGVKNHPFKNLRAMDKRMNIALGAIDRWIPNRNLKARLKNELLGNLSTTTGSNYEKALKKNFLKQADDVLVKGIVPEKKLWASTLEAVAKQKDLPQTQIKILQSLGYGKNCKATGGRVGFKDAGDVGVGQIACIMNDVKKTRADMKSPNVEVRAKALTKQRTALQLASKIPQLKKILKTGVQFGTAAITKPLQALGLTSGIGYAIEGIVEGGFYDNARRKGYSHEQAMAETLTLGLIAGRPHDVPWYGGAEKLREKELIGDPQQNPKVQQYVDALEEQDRIYSAIGKKERLKGQEIYDPTGVVARQQLKAAADVQDLARSGAYGRVDRTLDPESMALQAYNTAVERQQALDQRRRKEYLEKFDPGALEREEKSLSRPSQLKKRYQEMEEYKRDREGIFGGLSRKEYEDFQEKYPELKNRAYEDVPKWLQYLSTLEAKPEGSDKTYKELFPTPASRYDWDLMGEVARVGGVANMAGGGIMNLKKKW